MFARSETVDGLAKQRGANYSTYAHTDVIGGPYKDENRAWKEKYLLTSEANRPATYEILTEDLCSYHVQRISLGIITERRIKKDPPETEFVQAYAAGHSHSRARYQYPSDWHNANKDDDSTESEDDSVPDLVYVDTDDHVPNNSN
ncbi:unnamed protein product [Sphagnum jensenii]|uniref:Uncharacterized protein n=1 Tax=Sphagnum jensenii TaxID=128206 RepID=A0ABP0VI25_9BRYO